MHRHITKWLTGAPFPSQSHHLWLVGEKRHPEVEGRSAHLASISQPYAERRAVYSSCGRSGSVSGWSWQPGWLHKIQTSIERTHAYVWVQKRLYRCHILILTLSNKRWFVHEYLILILNGHWSINETATIRKSVIDLIGVKTEIKLK